MGNIDKMVNKKEYDLQHFDIHEFSCSCCGQNHMNENFIRMLDKARHVAEYPFVVISGYRCEDHNKNTPGNDENSSHIIGLAADIRADNSHSRYRILEALLYVGFRRIVLHKTFVHVDMDETKQQEIFDLKIIK